MRPILLRSTRIALAAAIAATAIASRAGSECTNPLLLDPPLFFLTGPNPHFMVAADFNEDGIPDLAVTNGDLGAGSHNASLAVMIGTGSRSYADPVLYPVGRGARAVVARDFNEDGVLDLAVSNLYSDTISVLLGNGAGGQGNGTFAATANFPAGPGPFEMVAEDFDGDGILDLAACLNAAAAVSVLTGLGSGGLGDGTFAPPLTFWLAYPSTGLATADFNADGFPDLAASQNGGGQIAVLLGTGAPSLGPGSFTSPAYSAAGPQPYHIHPADLNEDGVQDLAVANTAYGGVVVLLGQSNGTFTYQTALASGNSSTVATGDFNQDGILDIATGAIIGNNTGQAELFLGQGAGGVGDATFGSMTPYPTNGDVYQLITGDFDGDGLTDLLTAQGYGNYVTLLPGTCALAPPDPRAPVLTDVRDVPNDNGGFVFLTWTASSLDAPGGEVNGYRVWRRIPPALVSAAVRARLASREVIAVPRSSAATDLVYWEALATLPAQRLPGYGYTAATTQDSMRHSNPYTAFFVTALTSNIDVFYSSAVDSGYSMDNIRPATPASFTGSPVAAGFSLQWEPGADADLDGYHVYRGPSADFLPSEASRVAAPTEPGWIDPTGHGEWFYKLSAVDVHANESDFALLAPLEPTGVDRPAPALDLEGVRPNPSVDGRLVVSFSLERGSGACLDVVDLAGRRVFSQDLSAWGPGSHALAVGGHTPLASGVYFVRLIQGATVCEAKAVVTR